MTYHLGHVLNSVEKVAFHLEEIVILLLERLFPRPLADRHALKVYLESDWGFLDRPILFFSYQFLSFFYFLCSCYLGKMFWLYIVSWLFLGSKLQNTSGNNKSNNQIILQVILINPVIPVVNTFNGPCCIKCLLFFDTNLKRFEKINK